MSQRPAVYTKQSNKAQEQMPSYWQTNPQALIILISMWKAGYSAGQILKNLPRGVTRNAIIGKAHRLGLKKNIPPLRNGSQTATLKPKRNGQMSAPKHLPATELQDLPDEESQHAVSLYDAQPEQCRWLVGEMTYCGAPIAAGSRYSFCAAHYKRGVTVSYRSTDDRSYYKRWR